jgi:hypothetical protein
LSNWTPIIDGNEEGVERPSKLKPLVVALGALCEPESIGCDRSGQIPFPKSCEHPGLMRRQAGVDV